ncbi:hypothetical protein [Catalinimonas niigatensis]|uniref:hypothetical protein n=1 Tax=Catalinimonas niigatensis TaxID=1397264 RepID=UPI00266526C1|nr:hypothetical protein [Catalinimonas niigatensis]WPP52033.1 hypothetical protein PZB72_06525 [Catalinimonas niigatensis]
MKTDKKQNLLEYQKLIMEKVSFNKTIFWKEYRKSIRMLSEKEGLAFKIWLADRFGFRGRTACDLSRVQQVNCCRHQIRKNRKS